MNFIPYCKMEKAIDLFDSGATIRQVMKEVGIARETAHRLQKHVKASNLRYEGKVRVNTGKRADGSVSFYFTSEMRPHWEQEIV